MAGAKLNAATAGDENVVDIFGHSSEYFHGKPAWLDQMLLSHPRA